jgi:hypothetical protein
MGPISVIKQQEISNATSTRLICSVVSGVN